MAELYINTQKRVLNHPDKTTSIITTSNNKKLTSFRLVYKNRTLGEFPNETIRDTFITQMEWNPDKLEKLAKKAFKESRKLGKDAEHDIHNYFTSLGCVVHTVASPSKFQRHDLFACFDHCVLVSKDIVIPGIDDELKLFPGVYFVQTKGFKEENKALNLPRSFADFKAKMRENEIPDNIMVLYGLIMKTATGKLKRSFKML